MKIVVLIFAFFFWVTMLFSQGNFVLTCEQVMGINCTKEFILSHKIKSVKLVRFVYSSGKPSEEGRLVSETLYDTSGKTVLILNYDLQGNAERDSFFYNTAGKVVSRIYSKRILNPESQNKSTGGANSTYGSYQQYTRYNKGDGTRNKSTWQYDESGNKLGDIASTGNFRILYSYTYDKKNNLYEESWGNTEERENNTKYAWKPNSLGVNYEMTKFNSDQTNIRYVWKFDTLGRKIQETEYNSDGNITTTNWKFDSRGNMVDRTITYFDRAVNRLAWKYDENGNCTDEFLYQSDGKTPAGKICNKFNNGLKMESTEYDSNYIPVVLTRYIYEY